MKGTKLKRLTFEIAEPLARRLKVAAAAMGVTQTAIVREAIQKRIDEILDLVGPIPLERFERK